MSAVSEEPAASERRIVTYAIGDIHGRLDLLDQLLGLIEDDATRRRVAAKIVFTGDYIDRGPHSHDVVERLMAGPRRPIDRFVCLRGNHDDLFVKAALGGYDIPEWARILHRHTLLSYGTTQASDPEVARHVEFLAGLPLTHDDGVNLFVHAGIRPGVPLDEQSEDDLIWIRHDFLDHDGPLPRRVVHGHTIMGDQPVVTPNRVSIDTGAYRSGVLTAAVFNGDRIEFLQAVGAPDREAIVREWLLSATIHGRTVSFAARKALDDFIAERFDTDELTERLRLIDAA